MPDDSRNRDDMRLRALDRYAILDTPPEPGFDDLAELAKGLCKTPIALVSFIAEDRQWFKAHIGHEGSETPIAQSICVHAILEDELLVIPDLTQDARTRFNPLVTSEPHIRFYAGAVLRTPQGVAVGTLCVIDTEPRPEGLTAEQAVNLKRLARQVVTQMELRRALGTSQDIHLADVAERSLETSHLRRLLRDAPSFMAVLRGPEHVFELTNDSYMQMIGHRDLIGLPAREALPDLAGQGFFELLDSVYATGEPYIGRGLPIAVQREPDGPLVQAFLNFSYQPVFDDAGAVTGIFVEGNDVTDQRRAVNKLRESELKSRVAIEAAQMGVWECAVRDDRFTDLTGDERALELVGGLPDRQIRFEEVMAEVDPKDRAPVAAAGLAALNPEGPGLLDIEFRLLPTRARAERWVHARAQRIDDGPGTAARLVGTVRDVSQRKLAEARQRLLAGELQHRIKNILAMVTSIGNQTLRGKDILERRNGFMNRIEALSHAHDILMASSWSSASLREVVEGGLRATGDLARFTIEGPEIDLVSSQAMSMALTVHELATNATKYGALSTDAGRVSISWSVDETRGLDRAFAFAWAEIGGPEVVEPTAIGFGTKMITRVLAAEFSGDVGIDYAPTGIVCLLEAPIPAGTKRTSHHSSPGDGLSLAEPKAGK